MSGPRKNHMPAICRRCQNARTTSLSDMNEPPVRFKETEIAQPRAISWAFQAMRQAREENAHNCEKKARKNLC